MTEPRRLRADDAFRLPPATAGRFLLLILTALVSSVYAYYWIFVQYHVDIGASLFRCGAQAYATVDSAAPADLVHTFDRCQYGVNLRLAAYLAAPGVLLMLVTGAFYLMTPRLVLRRGAMPLDRVGDVPGVAVVREMVAQARRPVRVYVSVAPLVGLARTFGRFPRYRILLDARLLRNTPQGQAALRAVLGHELGHVANRDVDLTSMAIAVWWAFLAVVATPLVVAGLLRPHGFPNLAWRLAILVVLMWLTRVAVLRTREYYADLQVARTSTPDELTEVLTTIPPRPPARGPRSWLRWQLRSVHHPPARHRLAVLRGEARLHRLGLSTGAATGLLLGFGYLPAFYLVTLINPWEGSNYLRSWVVALLFGSLVAGVVTGMVWRAAQSSVLLDSRPPHTWPFAVAFTLGVLAAQYTAPPFPLVGAWGVIVTAAPLVATLSGLLLLLLTQVYLRWTMLGALIRLRRGTGDRRAYRFGVFQSAVVVAMWLAFWFLLNELVINGAPGLHSLGVVLFAVALDPMLQLTVFWACVYLVVVWYGTRTPLVSVLVMSGALTVGFALAGVPLYPTLKHGLIAAAASGHQSDLFRPLLLLAAVACAVTLVVGIVHGLRSGGRGRTGTAVASGLLALPIPALCAVPIGLTHVALSLCGLGRHTLTCVGGATFPSFVNGAMFMLLIAGMAVSAVPAILLGSFVRTIVQALSHRPMSQQPARGRLATVAFVLPVVVALGIYAYAGLPLWFSTQFSSGSLVAQSDVAGGLARQLGRPATMIEACSQLIDTGRVGGLADVLGSGYALQLTGAVVVSRAAPDRVLQKMSIEAADALRAGDTRRADTALVTMARYCTALPATAFAPCAYGPGTAGAPPSPTPSPSPAPSLSPTPSPSPSPSPSPASSPSASPDAPTVTEEDVAAAGCADCHIAAQFGFTHPSWGPVTLVLALSDDEQSDLLVFDGKLDVVWSEEYSVHWESANLPDPTMDATGNLFVSFNPGRYDGVIILRPVDDGFDDFDTLPDKDSGYDERFYSAELAYDSDSGEYAVRSEVNDCTPSCAEGTTQTKVYHFDGQDYVTD